MGPLETRRPGVLDTLYAGRDPKVCTPHPLAPDKFRRRGAFYDRTQARGQHERESPAFLRSRSAGEGRGCTQPTIELRLYLTA
jgi:hypothetical protein